MTSVRCTVSCDGWCLSTWAFHRHRANSCQVWSQRVTRWMTAVYHTLSVVASLHLCRHAGHGRVPVSLIALKWRAQTSPLPPSRRNHHRLLEEPWSVTDSFLFAPDASALFVLCPLCHFILFCHQRKNPWWGSMLSHMPSEVMSSRPVQWSL